MWEDFVGFSIIITRWVIVSFVIYCKLDFFFSFSRSDSTSSWRKKTSSMFFFHGSNLWRDVNEKFGSWKSDFPNFILWWNPRCSLIFFTFELKLLNVSNEIFSSVDISKLFSVWDRIDLLICIPPFIFYDAQNLVLLEQLDIFIEYNLFVWFFTQGCASWDWYYPYHYAPFASDFVNIAATPVVFKPGTKPVSIFYWCHWWTWDWTFLYVFTNYYSLWFQFKPLEQLMSVFPAASKQHVPEPWSRLMFEPVRSESILHNGKLFDYNMREYWLPFRFVDSFHRS